MVERVKERRQSARLEESNVDMGKYFMLDTEVPEPDAATTWFAYAGRQGIDMPKAISIWEDAATESGAESRRIVGGAGIRIDPEFT